MFEYLKTMKELLGINAKHRNDRTGVGTTYKTFNSMELNLKLGSRLPLITTKKVPTKSCIGESLAFWKAADNAAIFRQHGCNVWDDNANNHPEDPEKPRNAWLSNPWRKGEDDLGRVYGVQWRKWEDHKVGEVSDYKKYIEAGYVGIGKFEKEGETYAVWRKEVDQIAEVVKQLTNTPNTRRALISAWNPAELNMGALPPCHVLQQYLTDKLTDEEQVKAYVTRKENEAYWYGKDVTSAKSRALNEFLALKDKVEGSKTLTLQEEELWDSMPFFKLNLIMYQRSADFMLGSPFNMLGYSTILSMMARVTNMAPGSLHYLTGDTHLYDNHRKAAFEQTNRQPIQCNARLLINPDIVTLADMDKALPSDFRVINYENLGKLNNSTPMAI